MANIVYTMIGIVIMVGTFIAGVLFGIYATLRMIKKEVPEAMPYIDRWVYKEKIYDR